MAKVAMAVGEGFEDVELETPRSRLVEAGHDVTLLGVERGATVHGKRGRAAVTIDHRADEVSAADFDALVIPGGYGPDHLRLDTALVAFVREFHASGRPVAAICHGPQLLIEAGVVEGRTMTSWPSVRTDLVNAGARWVDEPVVEDGNLITSRKPDDLEAFCTALLRRL
ncbi:MAG: type 1 glutamine amidotransferase domain-containing protein [Gammaproteobacteria bacterium]|nr:type 1 glutamine amidotransferase domain-containing protein [Gammaproteobacteria bacterium]